MRELKILIGALLAGMAIGVGGITFLSIPNKIVGALMFTVGLYTIVAHKLNLFTGKLGYLVEEKKEYIIELILIWLGNFMGTYLSGVMINLTRYDALYESAKLLCEAKLNDNLLSLFILGIFCGLLMFVAVDGYKKVQNPLILFVCVAAFILCGFEHCIADMFYFAAAGIISLNALKVLLVVTVGNTIGGILIPLYNKIK